MLFQLETAIWFIIWLVLATILTALILYITVRLVDSKTRASDKKWMILIVAFIAVLIIPVVVGALNMVLGAIGDILAGLRSAIDGGGQNFLTLLAPIIAFLLLLILVKFAITDTWEHSLWISLITYLFLFILYCVLPELYNFIQIG
jgi:hypothetical protein